MQNLYLGPNNRWSVNKIHESAFKEADWEYSASVGELTFSTMTFTQWKFWLASTHLPQLLFGDTCPYTVTDSICTFLSTHPNWPREYSSWRNDFFHWTNYWGGREIPFPIVVKSHIEFPSAQLPLKPFKDMHTVLFVGFIPSHLAFSPLSGHAGFSFVLHKEAEGKIKMFWSIKLFSILAQPSLFKVKKHRLNITPSSASLLK